MIQKFNLSYEPIIANLEGGVTKDPQKLVEPFLGKSLWGGTKDSEMKVIDNDVCAVES